MKENSKDRKSDPIDQSETIAIKKADPPLIPESHKDIAPVFRILRSSLYKTI
jgi:hypothetical protein